MSEGTCYSCHYLCWCNREHCYKCSKLHITVHTETLDIPCSSWKHMKHKIAAKTCRSVADCTLGIPWCFDTDNEIYVPLSATEFTHFRPVLVGDYKKVPKKWLNETLSVMCLCIAKSSKNARFTFPWIERNFGLNPLTKDRIAIQRGTVWYNPDYNTWHGTFRVIRRCSNGT